MNRMQFKHKIAFGCWINDMKNKFIPYKKWPDVEIDEITMDSFTSIINLITEAGYNEIDFFGLLVGHNWPPDIISVLENGRKEKAEKIIAIAHDKGIKVIYGLGVYSWGFDEIIKSDPEIRGTNTSAMCGSKLKSQRWQERIIDFVASNFDIDGFHLEASDQGRCKCPSCINENNVQYYSRLHMETAKYIRSKWPNKILLVDNSLYLVCGDFYTEDNFKYLYELSKYIDIFIDNGNFGQFVKLEDRKKFISELSCDFGTSTGLWVYTPQNWERLRWFLPYTNLAGNYVKALYEDGAKACRNLMGPIINPGTEVNIMFFGLLFSDLKRDLKELLSEVLERLYKPKNDASCEKLTEIFIRAENAYFDNWFMINIPKFKNFLLKKWEEVVIFEKQYQKESFNKRELLPNRSSTDKIQGVIPGELHLQELLYSNNLEDHLSEPPKYLIDYMNPQGRLAYKRELSSIMNDLLKIENEFDDSGRIERIKLCIDNVIKDLTLIEHKK